VAITALGVAATAAAVMCVITAGDPAPGALTGTAIRTVVATAGPETPHPAVQAVTVTVQPHAQPEVPVRVEPGPAPAAQPPVDLRQIVYTVDGNQRPDDPVTVVYADETGALRTLENVTLPWSMAIIPTLPVNYVYATSRGSQLNCWITDAGGAAAVLQTDYGTSTACNR
jgi:hypothetical protein